MAEEQDRPPREDKIYTYEQPEGVLKDVLKL
jgi:hypothetical protein